jgi:protein kinase-like protein/PEGA domain-containing protein
MCGKEAPGSAGEGRPDGAPSDPLSLLRERLVRALEGRYEVHGLLGAGAMGAVFLADDLDLERKVAVKVLPAEVSDDKGLVERFKREAKTAAKLDHAHIIPIHRVESQDGLHYFVMKYVAGRTLESLLDEDGPASLPLATRVLREAAAALGHAHARGVVHRDVKPANIMLDADDRVVLTDFGISKISKAGDSHERLTQVGTVVGTPHYMAPEQALGQSVDGRADQYALAVVGFEMLTGQLPFDGESATAIIHQHINEAPPRLIVLRPEVPPHLSGAISRALSKAPSRRFDTLEEFAAAVEGVPMGSATLVTGSGSPAGAPTRVLSVTARATARTRKAVTSSATLLILILTAVAGVTGWVRSVGVKGARQQANRITSTVSAPAKHAADDRARFAELRITSKPNATVMIDGARVGTTPLTGRRLAVGRTYRIRLERKGYKTKRETIRVTGPETVVRRFVLSPDGRR